MSHFWGSAKIPEINNLKGVGESSLVDINRRHFSLDQHRMKGHSEGSCSPGSCQETVGRAGHIHPNHTAGDDLLPLPPSLCNVIKVRIYQRVNLLMRLKSLVPRQFLRTHQLSPKALTHLSLWRTFEIRIVTSKRARTCGCQENRGLHGGDWETNCQALKDDKDIEIFFSPGNNNQSHLRT